MSAPFLVKTTPFGLVLLTVYMSPCDSIVALAEPCLAPLRMISEAVIFLGTLSKSANDKPLNIALFPAPFALPLS